MIYHSIIQRYITFNIIYYSSLSIIHHYSITAASIFHHSIPDMDTERQSSSSSSLGSTSVSPSSSSLTSIGPCLNNHDSLNRSPSSLSTSAISHDGISRKRKSKRSASHTHSVKNRRVYSESEIQDKIARINYIRGHPSTTGFSTPNNLAFPSTSSGSRSLLLDRFSLS